jgi:hypothetical protein
MILIVGTLQIPLFTQVYVPIHLPLSTTTGILPWLAEIGLSLQGGLLIGLLVLIGILAWKGFEHIFDQFNRWTYAALAAIGLTILAAAPAQVLGTASFGLNGRFFGELIVLGLVVWVAARYFTTDELSGWIFESWKFVKQIFPLLIVGVFAAGMVKVIIPETWVQTVAGQNTIFANLIGVLFGVFMYFPTLVEVPIAKMFLDLGMARGPLLAYLLADPELSIQSILVLNSVMGRKKTAVYVGLVAVLSTLAGYLFGLFLAFL